MPRSDLYISPILPRVITDRIIKFASGSVAAPLILSLILPQERQDYPGWLLQFGEWFSHYIPIIKVISTVSFSPVLSLVIGSVTYLLMIIYGIGLVVIHLSGCNKRTCKIIQENYPELLMSTNFQAIFAILFFSTPILVFYVLPIFNGWPVGLPGFYNGRGLSYADLIKSHYPLTAEFFLSAHYYPFGLGLLYSLISFFWVAFVYSFPFAIKLRYCKWRLER